MEASTTAVRLVEATKRYGKVVAVDGVDLDVADGEFFSMLGPSGSGKTTCLRMIAGFERPTSGRVELHGEDVSAKAPFERDVNTVFQDYALFPHMTVAENVAYGLVVRKVAKAQRRTRVDEALAMVRLDGFADRKPSQLSGGQRQRVALARALINRPSVLLLDEPLGALDLKLRHAMQVELKAIQREVGITFLYVTHDQEEALTMSDRIAVFSQGRIDQVGSPAEVYERPHTEFVAGFVGISNLLTAEVAAAVGADPVAATVRPEKISLLDSGMTAPDGHIAVDASIRDVVYLGTFTRYLAELTNVGGGGVDLTVIEQNTDPDPAARTRRRGESVQLAWPRAATRTLSTDENPIQEPEGTT